MTQVSGAYGPAYTGTPGASGIRPAAGPVPAHDGSARPAAASADAPGTTSPAGAAAR